MFAKETKKLEMYTYITTFFSFVFALFQKLIFSIYLYNFGINLSVCYDESVDNIRFFYKGAVGNYTNFLGDKRIYFTITNVVGCSLIIFYKKFLM